MKKEKRRKVTIRLPRLDKAKCRLLTVCGQLGAPSSELAKKLPKEGELVAKYKSGKVDAYVRLGSGRKPGKHLHVDCAVAAHFPKGKEPETTHSKAEVLNLLACVEGADLAARITGTFALPLENIAPSGLVGSMHLRTTGGKVSIEVTASTFSITGTALKEVTWWIPPKSKIMHLRLAAERKLRVTTSYIKDSLDWLYEQLDSLVIMRTEDATH